jgi:hypothetical protein
MRTRFASRQEKEGRVGVMEKWDTKATSPNLTSDFNACSQNGLGGSLLEVGGSSVSGSFRFLFFLFPVNG